MPLPQQLPMAALQTLAEGGVVLCANARAARALRALYAKHARLASGRRAWETPQIFDWQQWLLGQWQRLLVSGQETRTLLKPVQEELLWNEIVRPGIVSKSLVAPAEVARLCARAYALLHAYGATRRLNQAGWDHAAPEPELFRRWALDLERRCERNGWLCEAALPWVVGDALMNGRLPAPRSLAWNGFDRLTPVDRVFRERLEQAGCDQHDIRWERAAELRLKAAPSVQDELEACAAWVRGKLEADPEATIGVLLPDVEAQRAEIDRVFRRVLSPALSGLAQREAKPQYEFTLGLPLAKVPAIHAALCLLEWCARPLPQDTITWMITSGFFSSARDTATLAEADIRMRKKFSPPELGMEDALHRLSNHTSGKGSAGSVLRWVRSLRQACALLPDAERLMTCTSWVTTTERLLRQAGWPGDRLLQSIDYQAQERWQRALDEVAALDFQDRRYSYADFFALLQAHLGATIFSPKSENAPVTVSGLIESSGRCFDAVWVLGATDTALPRAARRNIMLPSWLQNELGMPGCSAEQDSALAASVLARLRDSTGELIFSYAKEDIEGEQRASALLADVPEETTEESALRRENLTEPFPDEMRIAWPGTRAAGGQEVLKAQSACPFQAFAKKRLVVRALPSSEPGLSMADRGNIVHEVLHLFWTEVQDSGRLRALLYGEELSQVVQGKVAQVFGSFTRAASTAWEERYLQLEQVRVSALLEEWLRKESLRPAFAIAQLEKKETILIDGLELSVRMDRVDQLANGTVLIDYKTGAKVQLKSLLGLRPDEPQLPIYAISGKIDGLRDVAFAHVLTGRNQFISAVPDAGCFNGQAISPANAGQSDTDAGRAEFDELRERWRLALGALSREFQEGIATVTPKQYPATCKHCDYHGLCRVAESRGPGGDEDGEGDGEMEPEA